MKYIYGCCIYYIQRLFIEMSTSPFSSSCRLCTVTKRSQSGELAPVGDHSIDCPKRSDKEWDPQFAFQSPDASMAPTATPASTASTHNGISIGCRQCILQAGENNDEYAPFPHARECPFSNPN